MRTSQSPTRGNLKYAFNYIFHLPFTITHFPLPTSHLPFPHSLLLVFHAADGNVTIILITLLECKWKAHTGFRFREPGYGIRGCRYGYW